MFNFSVLQVRLQLQNFSHDPVPRYRGPLQTVGRIMKDEGATAPFKVRLPICCGAEFTSWCRLTCCHGLLYATA